MNGRERVARKQHRCNWLCGGIIEPGETYWNEGLGPPDHSNNDGWFTWKAHLECRAAWLQIADDLDGIFPSAPFEWLDYLSEGDPADPVVAAALERLRAAGWTTEEGVEA